MSIAGPAAAVADLQAAGALPVVHLEDLIYVLAHPGVQAAATPHTSTSATAAFSLPPSCLLSAKIMLCLCQRLFDTEETKKPSDPRNMGGRTRYFQPVSCLEFD